MVDINKIRKLAEIIVNYSISVKKGDNVLLKGYGFDSFPLIKEIYRECLKAGALNVDIRFSHEEISKVFMDHADDKQLMHVSDLDLKVADSYDSMVQIVADQNPYEMADVDIKKLNKAQKALKPLSDILHKKKWCLFYYPNLASAQTAKKSIEEWEDFVFDSCLKDWNREEKMQLKFVDIIKNVKQVHIKGDDTDLKVDISGQLWETCSGKCNLPDGEIFTSPIREGVNGVIKYNVPTRYQSKDFDWVKLWLENGKVVKSESNDTKSLHGILDTDEGAKYFGEFAFGLNNTVTKATRMILFDEKMGKSLHMALGKCYDECPNGNDSNIHWDLIFKFEDAHAEIYFDGEKVYENGKWIKNELNFLN